MRNNANLTFDEENNFIFNHDKTAIKDIKEYLDKTYKDFLFKSNSGTDFVSMCQDNLDVTAQDIADIAGIEIGRLLAHQAEMMLKENADLKKVIAHSDGVHMQNEDLIRENTDLKESLTNAYAVRDELLTKAVELKRLEENMYWKQEFERVANNYEKIWIENNNLKKLLDKDRLIGILKRYVEKIAYMPKDKGIYNELMGDKYMGRISHVIHEWQIEAIASEIRGNDV